MWGTCLAQALNLHPAAPNLTSAFKACLPNLSAPLCPPPSAQAVSVCNCSPTFSKSCPFFKGETTLFLFFLQHNTIHTIHVAMSPEDSPMFPNSLSVYFW